MKKNILHTNTCIAFNKHIGSIYSRFDSLSIVSRQSDLRTCSAESSYETFSVGQSSPLAFPFKAKSHLAFSRQSVLAIVVACLAMFSGTAWGTDITTGDLNFGTPDIDYNFNEVTGVPKSQAGNTSSQSTSSSLSGYGGFTEYCFGKSTSCKISIKAKADPMNSQYIELGATSNGAVSGFSRTFATKGAYSFNIAKSSVGFAGLYATDAATNSYYAKANSSVYLYFTGSKIQINDGTGWVDAVDDMTDLPSLFEVAVIYNNTNSGDTYGGSISISAKTAHIYVNGTAVMNGTGTAPKNFTIPGATLTGFRLCYNVAAATMKVDDIKIYDALPTAAGDAITLNKNNSDASGSSNGSALVVADATSLSSGFTAPTRTGYEVEGYYTTSACTTKIATNLGALQSNITVDAVNWTNGSSQWKKGGAATFYAKWTAKDYTVTLNDNGGSGGSGSKTVTFNTNTNMTSAVAIPTRKHYIFGGYWTSANSGVTLDTKIIDTDGTWVTSVTGYTDATPNWIKADNVTLYAKWTEHQYTNYRTKCCTILDAIDGTADMAGTETTMTIKNWSAVDNVSSYTLKLYKWNAGTSSWGIVSGSTTGGSSGTQGTRTAVTDKSTGVTWSGIEYGATYKVTVQAIGNGSTYCDGVETAIDNINSTDLTDNKITWLYSIYIDDGTQSDTGWGHHYIESLTSNAGSVDIELESDVDYYEYKLVLAGLIWYGNSGKMTSSNCTSWTFSTGASNCKIQTVLAGDYTFGLATGTPAISVTYPTANQSSGYKIYFDKSAISSWGSNIYYRIGKPSHHTNNTKTGGTAWTAVPGTDDFYVTQTMAYDGFEAWQIANNTAWCDDVDDNHSIYVVQPAKPSTNAYDITYATTFQKYVVGSDGITLVATSKKNTEDGCDFWNVSKSDGMLTHTATITTPSHGTITIAYTDVNSTSQSKTATTSGLAHRTVLTITATPATGYSLTSLTVDGDAHTSGNTYILDDDATIAATFTAQTSTVTLKATSATSGSDQTVLATYDASMPLVTTADKTPAVAAISRTGYNFNGWWDNTSGGKQYYSYDGSSISSANNWDKTGSQNLFAQWTAKEYSITLDREGGSTGATSATATYDSGTLTGWSAPTKTGYTFGGYWSGDNGVGTLVISTSGVLQNSVQISSDDWTDASGHWIKDGGVTVYAKWTADTYTISYKDQGNVDYSGSNSASLPTSHTYGAATDLVDGVRSGYRFDGWFDNSTCTGSKITSIGATAITANTTYYAKWTKIYSVIWKVNGETYETGVVTGNSQVANGEQISVCPTPPANNTLSCSSKFMGWSVTNIPAGSPVNGSSNISALGLFTDKAGSPTITKDTVFYAVFAKQTNSNGYKYIGDAGTLSDGEKYIFVDSKTAGSAHALKATDLAENSSSGKTGTAVGVTITSTAEGVLITTVNTDLEFEYASTGTKLKYTDGLTTKYLFINGNGVGYKTDDDRSTYGTHQLYGWTNKYANRYVYYNSTNFTISEDAQNMYAFIKQTPVYGDYRVQCDPNIVTVTYEANSGATSCENEEHDKRNDYTVCSSAPTRDYYTFAGWLCSADSKTYAASATIDDGAIDDNFTLTAQWTPVSYSISYNLNGGTNAADPISAYNVETTSALPTPTKGHDRFDGWYTDDGVWSNQVASITAGMHGNLTLYAKWTSRYEIVFDVYGGSTTTIYRAADENLESAVAGQGSKPSNPDAPSTCSTKTFVGWVESEIDDETDTKPASLTNATGTPTADKHYYATWALKSGSDIDAVEDNSFTTSGTGTYCGMTNGMQDVGDYILKNSVWSTDLTGSQVKIKVYHLSNSTADVLRISLINSSGTEVVGTDLTTTALNSNKTYAAYSSYVTLTPNSTVTGYKVALKTKNSNGTCVDKVTREVVATYSKYATSCCATKVTLSGGSPEHGTVEFAKSTIQTCDEDKTVKMTITPSAGYQLHTYSVATGDGKVATKSMSAEVDLDNNSSAAQEIDLTFAEDANGAYNVTATFDEMVASSWTWTKNVGGATITTDPVEVYVGQKVQVDVAYTPAGLLSSHTNNTAYNYSPSPWSNAYLGSPSKAGANFTVTGTNAGSTSVTLNHNDGLTKTINYTVVALPKVHFVDLVHDVVFADVVATISADKYTVTTTLATPTNDDIIEAGTTCEKTHQHLVGWIDGDWSGWDYLDTADGTPPTKATIEAAGEGIWIPAGENIDLVAKDGKTYYAVWAEAE